MAAKSIDIAIKQHEQQVAREMTSKFSARMEASVRELGRADTVRHSVLLHVATEQYDEALVDLAQYVESKLPYPDFGVRSERYISYAKDLVNAIKAKRSFPGLHHLATSKQQELFERAMEHFEELKATLKKIEQIDRQVYLEDIRSTVLVVKAVIFCSLAMLLVGFVMELSRGVLPAAGVVLDSLLGTATNWVFDHLGL